MTSEPWLCRTKLQAAAYCGHTRGVETLLAMGVPVDETDERGKSALMFAAVNSHVRAVEKLLAAGADVNRESRINSYTALLYATDRGHVCVVEALLRAGAQTRVMNNNGECALTMACYDGKFEVVETLLAFGADVNQRVQSEIGDEYEGFTPLIYAAKCGFTDIMEILLAEGAVVDATDACNYTALMHASESGSFDAVAILLAAGADISLASELGGSVLDFAASCEPCCSTRDLINVLLAAGAEVRSGNALSAAASKCDPVAVRCLLDAGADEHLGNPQPMERAVRRGSTHNVKLLIAAGADVNNHGGDADTPLLAAL